MKRIALKEENLHEVISEAHKTLQSGGLVIFPSDTVYGVAVNAQDPKAVDKLFSFKDRTQNKAVSIAVKSVEDFTTYTKVSSEQSALLRTIVPGPFTIILPSLHKTVSTLEAEDGTIGIRYSKNAFMNELSKSLDFPYTATSANLQARPPHYSIDSLLDSLSTQKQSCIDLIIDAGTLPHNKPSTVINLAASQIKTLRAGDFNFEMYNSLVSKTEEETRRIAKELIEHFQDSILKKPLVIILQGEMGAGKTVFTQGIGDYLGTKHVVSPTFVTYYEYETHHKVINKLHHFDLFQIDREIDLQVLSIPSLLIPHNLLVFEWGEKLGSVFQLFDPKKATILFISIDTISPTERKIIITKLS